LIRQAQAGEIELAYFDEAGFEPQPPNRSAWTQKGEVLTVTAKRAKRLNVLGAMLSSGRLFTAQLRRSVNGLCFIAFMFALIEYVGKKLVVILDNASIHKSKKMKPYREMLEEMGVQFYFLPPYCPELNRIEILWRKIKYEWLPFKSFTPDELEQALHDISRQFGSKYMMTFC
jgi:transposase